MSPGDNRQCSRGAESCWWGALTWSQRMVQSLQGGAASRMGLEVGAGEPPRHRRLQLVPVLKPCAWDKLPLGSLAPASVQREGDLWGSLTALLVVSK